MPRGEGTCRDHTLCERSDEFTPFASFTHSLTGEIEIEIEGKSDTEVLVGQSLLPFQSGVDKKNRGAGDWD